VTTRAYDGIRRNGKKLNPFMPVASFAHYDDTERHALWAYPAVASRNRRGAKMNGSGEGGSRRDFFRSAVGSSRRRKVRTRTSRTRSSKGDNHEGDFPGTRCTGPLRARLVDDADADGASRWDEAAGLAGARGARKVAKKRSGGEPWTTSGSTCIKRESQICIVDGRRRDR
jgi:hypothetical protein